MSRAVRLSIVLLCAACGGGVEPARHDGGAIDAPSHGGDAAATGFMTTVSAETANNTSSSPRFVDDYQNYNTTHQTGAENGDLVPGGPPATDLSRGVISKVPIGKLFAGARILAETQTWFCHLAANETAEGALVTNAKCGSHLDVGYDSDDPAHVARMVDDLVSRDVAGVVMDWSGKDSSHDGNASYYPTATAGETATARSGTEISTNAIYAVMAQAAMHPAGAFGFAVMEDEGITNCRNGWAGGCACWPAYGSLCDETSQVISDLTYIGTHWATSPNYLVLDGKPVVLFFAPDYNACPVPMLGCPSIDWNAVKTFVPNQMWIFEGKAGYPHTKSGGGFSWLATTLYPGSDTTFGVSYLADYDAYVTTPGHVGATQQVFGSAWKGFDDGFTDGWKYGNGSHTRYIDQRCGLTWLAAFAQLDTDFHGAGKPGLAQLQLVTWDDYEEGTELETGIDACIDALTAQVTGAQLAWTVTFGTSFTDATIHGSEDTIDHWEIFVSQDGAQLTRVASLGRDASGELPHGFDLSTVDLAPGNYGVFVEAIGKPFLTNRLSAPVGYFR